MALDTIKRTAVFLLLFLAQALVFNRIQLFNCATPLLIVYFVIMFPRNYPRWAILLWAFALGITVDMFANTPGVSSASMTLAAVLQPYLLIPFLPREPEEKHEASAAALGWGKFILFAFIITLLYCIVFFSLEVFSFFNWQHWLLSMGSSTLLTTALIATFENIRSVRKKGE